MNSERSDAEALLPPHISTEEYAAYTHFSSPMMTTMSTTISTNTATTAPTTNYFSPLKRKRDRSPLGVPETPWRLQPALTDEDDEATDVEIADDIEVITPSSGQASPRSRKLASQLEDLNLSVARPIFTSGDLGMATAATTMTTGQPAAKKPKNKTRLIATATTMTKVGNRNIGVLTKNNDGDSSMDGSENRHIESAEVTAETKGGVEWVDEPPLATRSISNGGDEMEENRNNNNHTKRMRLRSPPLPRMDTGEDGDGVVMDENEDVDSDDTEQLGIGYRPTPTQRYVRSQKRMQQIKEYKARISKEAREKRSESRRRRRSFPERQQVAAGESAQNEGSDEGGRKKTVQFKIDPVV
ncbi:uncharacterized protein H6S33_013011 [Morchella sextelata]|uniref:uncharacterized protein n=1 Tax=Morchella sextelata TaxID=1174677 RepID=UPI001D05A6BD|nr:uncharacterized protein H6S33_013011 [Morchella sextelata]KAH0609525.1 hypothetical protein H6S33_013011 [Morchella sextelata]